MDSSLEDLFSRVRRLERLNRIWRCCFATLTAGVALVVLFGAQQPGGPKKIEAQEIVVVDRDGNPRIRLEALPSGPLLTFLPKDGPPRLFMGLGGGPAGDNGAPYLNFRGAAPAPRLALGVLSRAPEGDSPYINVSDTQGASRAAIGLEDGQHPYFNLRDENHTRRLVLGLKPHGGPSIELMNDKGSTVLRIPTGGSKGQ